MPKRICQRPGCGHTITNDKARFCHCEGCECLKLDKRERTREARARAALDPRRNRCLNCKQMRALLALVLNPPRRTWLIVRGRRVGVVSKETEARLRKLIAKSKRKPQRTRRTRRK